MIKSLLLISFLLSVSADDGSKVPVGLRGHREEQTFSEENAIVGGQQAALGQFPFYVQGSGCGASLIHPDIALTAAHCVADPDPQKRAFDVGRPAWVGAYYSQSTQGNAERILVSGVVAHGSYSRTSLAYDFAILKLDRPVTNSSYLKPISYNSLASRPADGQLFTAIGLGQTNPDRNAPVFPSILRAVNLTKFPNANCTNAHGSFYQSAVMFCGGVSGGGKSTCAGDSGGPIFTHDRILIGVSSYGGSPCATAGAPSGYARVSAVKPWIDSKICTLSAVPPCSCTNSCATRLELKHDNFPRETSWTLTNTGTGAVVARQVANQVTTTGFLVNSTYSLGPGIYNFTIRDAFGDGICCADGNGWYRIAVAGNTVVTRSNVNWRYSDSFAFPIKAVRIEVKHDDYPQETAWTLTNTGSGVVVARQAIGQVTAVRFLVDRTYNLGKGTYKFTITDSEGDGICCDYSSGWYRIRVAGTVLVLRNNVNWGSSNSFTFTIA